MTQEPLVLVVDDFQDNREMFAEFLLISGFRVGGCFLSVGEMDEFISTQPHFAPHEVALLLTAQPTGGDRRLP